MLHRSAAGLGLLVLLLLPSTAEAQMVSGASGQRQSVPSGYDQSWTVSPYWPGEWPMGFAVARQGVSVEGRTGMDKALPRSVACTLPYRAVFNPWNGARSAASKVEYFSAAKLVPLKALKAFRLDDGAGHKVSVKKGQTVDYLGYLSEGWFSVRVNGKVLDYAADQSLFDDGKLSPLPDATEPDELWLSLQCDNGPTAWLFVPDLLTSGSGSQCGGTDPTATCQRWPDGLWNAGSGSVGDGVTDYAEARDLTDAEIAKGPASLNP